MSDLNVVTPKSMPNPPMEGRLDGKRHLLPLRVYYEDTDAAGIVYYGNYLRFIERGRTEMMRGFGLDHRAMAARDGIAFAVRKVNGDYIKPARLDDPIVVETILSDLKGASMVMEQRVLRTTLAPGEVANDPLGIVLVRFTVTLACMTLEGGRAARIPADLRGAIAPYVTSS